VPEINLGPVDSAELRDEDRPGTDLDLLSFGPEPAGADRPAAGWTGRYLRLLPARWRRPVPRSLVALGTAMITAAAVTAYLDQPDAEPVLPLEPARLISPESWLDVQEGGYPFPFELSDRVAPRVAQVRSRHPADAIVTVPLDEGSPALVGLPPGAYRVQATCSLVVLPAGLRGPLQVSVQLRDPSDRGSTAVPVPDVPCDGDVHTTHDPLDVSGHRAYFAEMFFVFDEADLSGGDPYSLVRIGEPVVLISFTPAG